MKSWQTTLAGIAAIVAAIANAIVAQFDTEPLTVPDWPLVIAAISAGIGLIRARDNDKSSEDVGAKGVLSQRLKFPYASIVLLAILLPAVGCSEALSNPFQPNAAGEESSGWTDADQRDIRIVITLSPLSRLDNNHIELWVDAVSGNERGGAGSRQEGGTIGDTTQTPTTDVKPQTSLEIPLTP
jgi:hypothetical protein